MYDSALSPAGLRIHQFAILSLVGAGGGDTAMNELASRLELDPSTATRTVQPLVDAGWLTATRQDHDRRSRLLSLTPLGHRKLAEAAPLWQHVQDRLDAGMGKRRVERMKQDLAEASRIARGPSDEDNKHKEKQP